MVTTRKCLKINVNPDKLNCLIDIAGIHRYARARPHSYTPIHVHGVVILFSFLIRLSFYEEARVSLNKIPL
jgi:hypothetical protein